MTKAVHLTRMRSIEYKVDLVPEGGFLHAASVATLTKSFSKDPAGHTFHELALKQAGLYVWPSSTTSDDDYASSTTASTPLASQRSSASLSSMADEVGPGVQWKGKGKKKKKKDEDTRVDLYALLGLQNERYLASESEIRNAYRRLALELHPDKCAAGVEDEDEREAIEARFKQFQQAYETLSNPTKRREFDSTDEFDDTLPYDCNPADFFKVFAPAFRRNSRWSSVTPVPDVGDDNTPWEEVDAFYVFWFNFRSWREFPHPEEEDIEQAENREHARWIKRYNTKLREKGKKEEKARLKEFVEAAYKRDPRVIARKEAERAKREAKRLEKEAEARRKEEEAAKAAAEEAARLAEEAVRQAEAKKARQVEKKALQKERSRLRTLLLTAEVPAIPDVEHDDVERLCSRMALDELRALTGTLSSEDVELHQRRVAFTDALSSVGEVEAAERAQRALAAQQLAAQQQQAARDSQQSKAAARAEWSDEEVRLLQKAINKFPVGTAKRWEQVAAYVRTRTVEEVLDMAKHGLTARTGAAAGNETWRLSTKRAPPTIGAAPDSRMAAFSDVDINISGAAAAVLLKTPQAENGGEKVAANGTGHPEKAAATAAATSPPSAGEWTEEQEVALVKALKVVDKAASDRWEQVSLLVPGKSKAACFRRFKELKENFRAKKATEA